MTENHLIYKENLAAYALGALDAGRSFRLGGPFAHLRLVPRRTGGISTRQRRASNGPASSGPRVQPEAEPAKHLQSQVKPARPQLKWSLNQMADRCGLCAAPRAEYCFGLPGVYPQTGTNGMDGQYGSQQSAIAMLAYPSTQSVAFRPGRDLRQPAGRQETESAWPSSPGICLPLLQARPIRCG